MTIPSGKGRNGDLSIAIILLKCASTFLASFQEYITEHQSKTANRQCSPNLGESHDGSPLKKVSLLASTRAGVEDSARTFHCSYLGDIGNEPLAESGLLDLTWGMAYVDDQPIDLQHPNEGILVEHRGGRPMRVHGIHAQQIANLLRFGLHGRRTQCEIFPDLAGRKMGRL